ncbi:MAG: hypothetical protein ACXWZM_01620 [Solirubrobacterales bacterium]
MGTTTRGGDAGSFPEPSWATKAPAVPTPASSSSPAPASASLPAAPPRSNPSSSGQATRLRRPQAALSSGHRTEARTARIASPAFHRTFSWKA